MSADDVDWREELFEMLRAGGAWKRLERGIDRHVVLVNNGF